ncbi:MAG: hypothetical protein JNK05_30530 [Myxococcales bacterium]|nr:hypothetical protein [Myxococcales bacterium]
MPPSLPTVVEYLSALPAGDASHPQCMVKASLVRNALADKPLGAELVLPAAVRALVDSPPPVSVWIPEVHFNVVMHAIRDGYFGGRRDEFLSWVYTQNRQLLSTTLYRAVFLVLSPERLLVNMEKRWASLRCGTTLTHERFAAKDLELTVRTPPHLYSTAVAEGMATAVRAAIDSAGTKSSEVEHHLVSATEVRFRVRWT